MKQRIIDFSNYLFGNNPTWPEISAVFNLLPEAALLFNRATHEVVFANRKFLELTAFTLQETLDKPYTDFLPDYSPAFWDDKRAIHTSLVRRLAAPLGVRIESAVLDEEANWILLRMTEAVPPPLAGLSPEEQVDLLLELIKYGDVSDENQLYELVLEAVPRVLGTNMISIYRGDSLRPQAVRVATTNEDVFPAVLSSADMIRLSELVVWKPGRRMFTELHRQGRIAGMRYVASVPIGQKEASLGLLVVGDVEREPVTEIGKILDFFHFYIGEQLQKLTLIRNLSSENQRKGFSLSVLSGILEHIDEGVVVVTPNLKVVEINTIAAVLLGYSCAEVCGQSVENVLIGVMGLVQTLENCAISMKPHTITKTTLHRRDGTAFPVDMQVVPIIEEGHARALLILIQDVSEEEQTRLRTEQLENHAMLGEFTAIFAHEVRNPINNISTGLQLLANKMEGETANLELIERAQNDCTRLTDLMDSVLAFSRPTDQKFMPVDVPALVQRVLNRWYPRMARVNIESHFKAGDDLPVVTGDYRSLERVFTNLISNAVDVMRETGGTLSVRVRLKEIANQQPQVEVTVADNGPGIPDKLKDRIFEPFVTNKPRGTGLGLAITKQIVTSHRGAIYVNSFPGGTVFHVELPAAKDGDNR